MFYIEFVSASKFHLVWIQRMIFRNLVIHGRLTGLKKHSFFKVKFAKKEALEIVKKMYYNRGVICLSRKRLKINRALKIEQRQQKTYK